jgi:hypothetical protein
MCEVSTIIAGLSLVAGVAGSAMQAQGQERAQKERQQTLAVETQNQAGARRGGIQAVEQAAAESTRPAVDQTMGTNTQRREANLAEVTAAPTAATPNGIGGNSVVSSALGANRDRNAAVLGQTNAALASSGGWSDALFGLQRTGQRSAENVAQAIGNARGSASTFPARLAADAYAGAGQRLAGDGLVAAGALGPGAAKQIGNSNWLSYFPSLTGNGGGAKVGFEGGLAP